MIASKQIAFGKEMSGKMIPIEYLESTGTQYIELSIVLNKKGLHVKCLSDYFCLGTVWDGKEGPQWTAIIADSTRYRCFYGNSVNQGFYREGDGAFHTYSAILGESLSIDGSLVLDCTDKGVEGNTYPAFLFMLGNPGRPPFEKVKFQQKIKSFVVTDGTTMIDLIPVRIGNVGYMYDRVSGQLFGNSGEGQFVLGPDIISSAFDYIQDGLVAMWDGIENAGWGLHDPNATVWKDLVGGSEDSIVGTIGTHYKWDSNSLVRNIENKGYFISDKTALLQDNVRAGVFSVEIVTSKPVGSATWHSQVVNICQTSDLSHYNFGIVARWRIEDDGRSGSVSNALYYDNTTFKLADKSELCTLSLTYNGSICSVYSNGILIRTARITPSDIIDGVHVRLGTTSYGFCGHYHCLRISSFALTADDVAYNYSIDKARFGL